MYWLFPLLTDTNTELQLHQVPGECFYCPCMSQPGSSKPSKQQPKASTYHGNRAQSPPCRDWDCFEKPFTSNLCKILAELRQALSQQAPDSSLSHLQSLLEGTCFQQRLSPSRKQAETQGRQRSTPTSAPLQPQLPLALCPCLLRLPSPCRGLHGGLSQPKHADKLWEQQLSLATSHSGESLWASIKTCQHKNLPGGWISDLHLASSATSGAHGQADQGQGAAGHHAGLGLLSRKRCRQGLGG